MAFYPVGPFDTGTDADPPAPADAAPQQAVYIDPLTRDYVFAADGEFERMPEVRQQMLLAVSTTLGSSVADPELGLRKPAYVGKKTQRQMRDAVIRATRHIVDAGRAVLLDVRVEDLGTGRVLTKVSYRDLTIDANEILTF